MLPVSPLATGSVEVAGQPVAIRSLSRAETLTLRAFDGHTGEAEAYVVSCGTGEALDDARAWLDQVDSATAALVVEAVLDLSGLLPRKPSNSPSSGA